MSRSPSETPTCERLIFFFVRRSRPSIKQIIFQKYCINGTTRNDNLHILYHKTMKFNMY